MLNKMNIIFLDVDGVLNSRNKLIELYEKTGKQHSGTSFPFDEKCLINLKMLVEETNSKIVITSTWRKYKCNMNLLLNVLKQHDLDKNIIGCTPILNTNREIEIIEYLNTIEKSINYVIIDDIKDMGDLNKNLVVTSPQTGFTEENLKTAIKILKKG